MTSTRRVIALLGGPPVTNEETAAVEAITPGHLVMLSGGGVIKNTDDAANVARAFALERDEFGSDIDVPYAISDVVKVGVFCAGQRVYAFVASGENVAVGDYLTTDNAGRLTKTSVSAHIRIARAVEAINNSAGPGDARVRAEII
jgi:hypothetical protein